MKQEKEKQEEEKTDERAKEKELQERLFIEGATNEHKKLSFMKD